MDKYEIGRRIGQGSYGSVYIVARKSDGKELVVKEMSVENITDKEREAFDTEIRLLRKLEHPCIVGYEESFLDESQTTLCIVMSYCEGGDLTRYLKNRRNQLLTEAETMHYFVQLALALDFLHSNNVVHRDLKAQNVFLTNGLIKLGDLGIAKELTGTSRFAQTCIGTPYYMGPELFKNRPYNHKSDVWSLGIVLYELATLKHPFDAQSLNGLVGKILKGVYSTPPPSVSKSIKLLVRWLLNLNPQARPEVSEVLTKPYVRSKVGLYVASLLAGGRATSGELNSLRAQLVRLGMDDLIQRLDYAARRNNMLVGANLGPFVEGSVPAVVPATETNAQDLNEQEAALLRDLAERDNLLRQEDQARARAIQDLERAVARLAFPSRSNNGGGSNPSRPESEVISYLPTPPPERRVSNVVSRLSQPHQQQQPGRPRFHGIRAANNNAQPPTAGGAHPPTRLSNASPRPSPSPPANVVMPGAAAARRVGVVGSHASVSPSAATPSRGAVGIARKAAAQQGAENPHPRSGVRMSPSGFSPAYASPSGGARASGSGGPAASRASRISSQANQVSQAKGRLSQPRPPVVSTPSSSRGVHDAQSRNRPVIASPSLPSHAEEEHKKLDVVESYVADYLMDLAADADEIVAYRGDYRRDQSERMEDTPSHEANESDEAAPEEEEDALPELDDLDSDQKIAAAKAEAEAISAQLAGDLSDSTNSTPILPPKAGAVDQVPELTTEKGVSPGGVASSIEQIEKALEELRAGRERLMETLIHNVSEGTTPTTDNNARVPELPMQELQSYSDLVAAEPGMGPSPRTVFEMHGHDMEGELPNRSYAATPVRPTAPSSTSAAQVASPPSLLGSQESLVSSNMRSPMTTGSSNPRSGFISQDSPSQPLNRAALVRQEREMRRRQEEEHHRELLARGRIENEESRREAAQKAKSLFRASPEFERVMRPAAAPTDWGDFSSRNRLHQQQLQFQSPLQLQHQQHQQQLPHIQRLQGASKPAAGLPPPLPSSGSKLVPPIPTDRDQLVSLIRSVESERRLIQDLRASIQLSSARLMLGRKAPSQSQSQSPMLQSGQPQNANSPGALPSSSSFSPAEIAPGSLLEQGERRQISSYSQLYQPVQHRPSNQYANHKLVDDYVYDSVGTTRPNLNATPPGVSVGRSNSGNSYSHDLGGHGLALNQGAGISVHGSNSRSRSPVLFTSAAAIPSNDSAPQSIPGCVSPPPLLDPLPVSPPQTQASSQGQQSTASVSAAKPAGSASSAQTASVIPQSHPPPVLEPILTPAQLDDDPLRDFHILYQQCLAAFGKTKFKEGFSYLKDARSRGENEQRIVEELTNRLGADKIHLWKLLDELVFIENST